MSNVNKLLCDFNYLEYDRNVITEAMKTDHGTFTIKGVLQRANAKNQNGRVYPREILEREAQKYEQEFVAQRRALGELDHPECHRNTAEILTNNGWQKLKDVTVGTVVPTLTSAGRIEYHPIRRVINQPYKGTMISIKGKNIDVLVTPNHRFVVQNRKGEFLEYTAAQLLELSKTVKVTHLTIPKTGMWNGTHYDEFELPAVELKYGSSETKTKQSNSLWVSATAWFSFLGIYLAEGHITNRNKRPGFDVWITQKEGINANKIRSILNSLALELKWSETISSSGVVKFRVSDARLWTYLNKLGNKYTKYIPQEIKNASTPLLQELFNGYLMGDGTTVEYKGYLRSSIFSVSKQLMEDFQEVLLKLDMSGRIKTQISQKAYAFAGHEIQPEKKKPLYRLWIEKSKNIHLDFRFITIEEKQFDDTVHCVTVENGTFYCRDQGKAFWSGNSTVVNLKNVSHNIVEMWWQDDDLCGTIEILSTPAGNIVKELMRNGIRLGVSSRGVGSVRQMGENVVEVDDDFNLICFDIVSNPSTQGAFLSEGYNHFIQTRRERVNGLIVDFFGELGA